MERLKYCRRKHEELKWSKACFPWYWQMKNNFCALYQTLAQQIIISSKALSNYLFGSGACAVGLKEVMI